MSKNKAEQQLDQRLIADIEQLKRDMKELKTRQLIGADVIDIETIPSGTGSTSGGPLTLAAGAYGSFQVTNTPANSYLTQWNFLATIYIDGTASADRSPAGANMTTGKLKYARCEWTDWADSSDSTNTRVYYIRIHNEDSSSHQYYLAFKAYLPKIGGGSAVNPGTGGS